MKKIIFLLCFCGLAFASHAENITVIYTGNSYSSLYPCGHCPSSVGGGVVRRATVINETKSKSKNVILIDAGNFSAGGPLDENKTTLEADRARTTYYYKTLKAMGYDVVGLGDSDFNFGIDYIRDNIRKTGLKAISANFSLDGVSPYFIKEFSGFKIAVIGLTPQVPAPRTPIKLTDYETALKASIDKIKSKVSLIILVSPLGDKINSEIAAKYPDVNLILSSGNLLSSNDSEKINDTFLLRPSYLAKEMRIANIEIKNKKIAKLDLKKEKLALTVKENPEIKKIIPACFKDGDCQKKEGLSVVCQNRGAETASCMYFEPNKIEVTAITDTACSYCTIDLTKAFLKDIFLGVSFKIIDYKDAQGKELIKKYNIVSLPAFILPPEIKKEQDFPELLKFLDEKNGDFLLKPQLSGLF
ncbi:MAG: hypothetical protein PHP17_04535, partial [Candidatus Omnitrophica bacterium]|nr:hypothetical protein [Candidatus Omnitrophota bacterium]